MRHPPPSTSAPITAASACPVPRAPWGRQVAGRHGTVCRVHVRRDAALGAQGSVAVSSTPDVAPWSMQMSTGARGDGEVGA